MNVKLGDLVELEGADGVWRVIYHSFDEVNGYGTTSPTAWVSNCDDGARICVFVGNLRELPDVAFTKLVKEARRERQAR